MPHSWFIYTTLARPEALRAVEATYVTLGKIVGEDLAEHLDPGEELEPPSLGAWPDIKVASGAVPEAALALLAGCKSTIKVEGAKGFDPALVSAVRALLAALGPCVFAEGKTAALQTSEALLKTIEKYADLAAALREVTSGDDDDDDDEEEEEDEEDTDDEDDEDDEDEPAPDSARPAVLRTVLGAISQVPRARRKAAELLGAAPEIVGKVAERLARVGAESDADVAKALAVTEKDVVGARKALATLLRRAENR